MHELSSAAMRVRFRGVRGSVPWAVPSGIGHGCNTPCIEITDERTGAVLLLDAGSGIVGVGPGMIEPTVPIALLLTHYHWDHLQGLPFFEPFYRPGWETAIYSPALLAHDPGVAGDHVPLPVLPRAVSAPPEPSAGRAREARGVGHSGVRDLGAAAQSSRRRARVSHSRRHRRFRLRDRSRVRRSGIRRAAREVCAGAAALVLDAHFTPQELPQHRGWGHSDWRRCAEFAAANDIGGLWLFHHKPGRTDEELVRIRTDARRIFRATEDRERRRAPLQLPIEAGSKTVTRRAARSA